MQGGNFLSVFASFLMIRDAELWEVLQDGDLIPSMHLTIDYLDKSRFLDNTNRVRLFHNEVYVLF